jgi:hypothetical protein
MGDASGSEASPVRPQRARPVWVRRCLSCDRDDVSPALGRLVPGASLVSFLPVRPAPLSGNASGCPDAGPA